MNHHDHLRTFVNHLRALNDPHDTAPLSDELLEPILALLMLDLEPLRPHLRKLYPALLLACPRRAPWDPLPLLRALVLSACLGLRSPHALRKRLLALPLLALACGFEPDHIPGTTTFYDFIHRLIRGPAPTTPAPKPQPRPRTTLRHLHTERTHRKDKLHHDDIEPARLLVQRVLARVQSAAPAQATLAQRLNQYLHLAVVIPSAHKHILSDGNTLTCSLDSTSIASAANRWGQKACSCEQRRCDCHRRYSDPDAQLGYDSYRDEFFFGYKLTLVGVAHKGRDLPIALSANPANVPDVLAAPEVIEGLHERFKGGPFHLRDLVMDTGYDAAAMYTLCSQLKLRPIIPLHPNSAKGATERDGLKLDTAGRPLCPGGAAMLRHGKTPNGQAVVWHCPAKPMQRQGKEMVRGVDLSRCPLGSLCEPESKMGPLTQVDVEKHGRFSPEVPRNSQQFGELYKQRSGIERINGSLKKALGERPFSSQGRLEVWTACWVMWRHARAWVHERFGKVKNATMSQLLDMVEALARDAATAAATASAASAAS